MTEIHLIDVARRDVLLGARDHFAEVFAGEARLEVHRAGSRVADRFLQVREEFADLEPAIVGVPMDQRVIVKAEAK
jgi:hypothetical protein